MDKKEIFKYQPLSYFQMAEKNSMIIGLIDILFLILVISFLLKILNLSGSLVYLQVLVFIASVLLAAYALLNFPKKNAWLATLLVTIIMFLDQIVVWSVLRTIDIIPLLAAILIFIPTLNTLMGSKGKKRSVRTSKKASKKAKRSSKRKRR